MNKTNSRYDIDRVTYALIVDPVSVNDSSTSYECQVYVQNPITGTKQQLHSYPQQTSGVMLSLFVNINDDSKRACMVQLIADTVNQKQCRMAYNTQIRSPRCMVICCIINVMLPSCNCALILYSFFSAL